MNTSEYPGNQDFEWAIKLNRISLEIIGLWPKPMQNRKEKLICNLRTLVAFLTLLIGLMIPSLYSLIKVRSDMTLTADNLIIALPTITCSIRILIFWWKKEAIVSIIIMIAEDWIKSKSRQEKDMMIRWAQNARTIVKCSYCIMGVGFTIAVILPRFGLTMEYSMNTTTPDRPLIIQSCYIHDINKRINYEVTFISQAISLFFGAIAYAGIDNFLGFLVFHICGQLDILKNRLTYLHGFKDFYVSLKNNIMDHRRLLRAIAVIEDTYNIILFTLFLYFAIVFAFCGFLIIKLLDERNDGSILRLAYFVIIVIAAISHMFLYCAVGELLVIHCDGVYYATCNQEWYSLCPKDAKNLIPLLIRSKKPPYLTAGKVFLITIPTFCNLIKTSTGYISVLLTTKN